MSFTQLNPTIPVETPRGKGMAIGILDYGPEHDLQWLVFLDTRECWQVPSPQIMAQVNVAMGRMGSGPLPTGIFAEDQSRFTR